MEMTFLTKDECSTWCRDHGYAPPSHPRTWPSADRFFKHQFDIPNDAGARVALCKILWNNSTDRPAYERLLWVEDWGIWPSGEFLPLFAALRSAFGDRRPLIEAPGHLLTEADVESGLSLFIVNAIFLWDCWL